MEKPEYRFVISDEDKAAAGRAARALADELNQVEGILEVDRRKEDESTMDLGVIVTAVATSGATLAIAKGVSWLRARRGASITIELDGKSGSVKAAVAGLDAEAAVRIAEIVRG